MSIGPLIFLSEYASGFDEILPLDPHYCQEFQKDDPDCSYYEAGGFLKFDLLTAKQKEFLKPILEKFAGLADDDTFYKWSVIHNDLAAEFMAITKALSRLKLVVANDEEMSSLGLIVKVNDIQGDRIEVQYDPTVYFAWKANHGKFRVDLANGGKQSGDMDFADHTVWGKGELIDGFDYQWFSGTTSRNSPRFHFNFKTNNRVADMHLDVAVWIWGFIPNFAHLTYGGADPRQYFDKIVKRFGNPGYLVRERIVPNPISQF